MKEISVALHSAKPATTGTKERLTIKEVRSPSISRAKMTVKKGADDLTVSVKETATYLRRHAAPHALEAPLVQRRRRRRQRWAVEAAASGGG